MRIAHVVTLNSADGAYGGPVSVMKQQTRELARRGHDVTVFCGWDGKAHLDTSERLRTLGFRTRRILPGLKFAGLAAPAMLVKLRKLAPTFDAVHVHLARDLITMPAAMIASRHTSVVVQTHGMIAPDQRVAARVFDKALTRRTLTTAKAVLSLTAAEDEAISSVSRGAVAGRRLMNGIAIVAPSADRDRRKVVFCARLHPRKRVVAFVELAELLTSEGVTAKYVIAGPDEGDLAALQARLVEMPSGVDIAYVGALDSESVHALLSSARLLVLPSIDEPFPMTVLESLAVGTPAVITKTCGIADALLKSGGAAVTDGSPQELASAVRGLLDDDDLWRQQRDAGKRTISATYSIESVVDVLERMYLSIPARSEGA